MAAPTHPKANDAVEQLLKDGHSHKDIALALAGMVMDGAELPPEPAKEEIPR